MKESLLNHYHLIPWKQVIWILQICTILLTQEVKCWAASTIHQITIPLLRVKALINQITRSITNSTARITMPTISTTKSELLITVIIIITRMLIIISKFRWLTFKGQLLDNRYSLHVVEIKMAIVDSMYSLLEINLAKFFWINIHSMQTLKWTKSSMTKIITMSLSKSELQTSKTLRKVQTMPSSRKPHQTNTIKILLTSSSQCPL